MPTQRGDTKTSRKENSAVNLEGTYANFRKKDGSDDFKASSFAARLAIQRHSQSVASFRSEFIHAPEVKTSNKLLDSFFQRNKEKRFDKNL